jgi:hypothetical protein
MPEFIPGHDLSRLFYWEIVRPRLDQLHPRLPYADVLHSPGREMLELDTQMPRPPTPSGGGTGGAYAGRAACRLPSGWR